MNESLAIGVRPGFCANRHTIFQAEIPRFEVCSDSRFAVVLCRKRELLKLLIR
jgi:hypothetical protein